MPRKQSLHDGIRFLVIIGQFPTCTFSQIHFIDATIVNDVIYISRLNMYFEIRKLDLLSTTVRVEQDHSQKQNTYHSVDPVKIKTFT